MRSNKNRCGKHWKHSRKHMRNAIRTATKSKNLKKTQTKYKFSLRYVSHKYTFLENTRTKRTPIHASLPKNVKSSRHPQKKKAPKHCQCRKYEKIRINWKGYDTWPGNLTDPDRPYIAVCVRACVRACKQARQNNFPVELTPPTSDPSKHLVQHANQCWPVSQPAPVGQPIYVGEPCEIMPKIQYPYKNLVQHASNSTS